MNFSSPWNWTGIALGVCLFLPLPVDAQINEVTLTIDGEQVGAPAPVSSALRSNVSAGTHVIARVTKRVDLRELRYSRAAGGPQGPARMAADRALQFLTALFRPLDVMRVVRSVAGRRARGAFARAPQEESTTVPISCQYYAESWSPVMMVEADVKLYVAGAEVDSITDYNYGAVSGTLSEDVTPVDYAATVDCYLTSSSGSAQRSGQLPPVPSGESTTAAGWVFDTKHNFSQTLSGSGPFNGRIVRERDLGGGFDGCHFSGSDFDPFDKISGGQWTVNGSVWQYDQIGYGVLMVQYYRTERPNRGLPHTQFRRECKSTLGEAIGTGYRNNWLKAGIEATKIWVERDAVKVEKSY